MTEPLIAYGILAAALIIVFAVYTLISKKSESPEETAEVESEPVIIIEEESYEDENELIAVISAAVAAYLNSVSEVTISEISAPATKFRVVSFRKVK